MSGKPTPGSATGTKVVILEGGPPEWAGQIDGLSRTCERAERWDHTADAAVVWAATDEYRPVEIMHEYRTGPKAKSHMAQVFRYVGYREDLGG